MKPFHAPLIVLGYCSALIAQEHQALTRWVPYSDG